MAENEDDAWLDQLREALASTEEDGDLPGDAGRFRFAAEVEPRRVTEPEPPAMAQATPTKPEPPSPDEGRVGLAGVQNALRVLSVRMSAVESLVEDAARQSRRVTPAPTAAEIEQIVTKAIRAVLPEIVEAVRRQSEEG